MFYNYILRKSLYKRKERVFHPLFVFLHIGYEYMNVSVHLYPEAYILCHIFILNRL